METRLNVNADSLLAELDWIRSLALQLVRDVAKADDLVQETLVAALERQPDDRGPLRPWLGVVLRRRASLMRRGDVRRRAREEREARNEDLPSAHELAARAETQRDVVDAVLALSEPYRSTVLLRYFEGLAPQEIARRRGIPAATARTHLSRGLDDLRRELDKRHKGDSRSWCLALIPLAAERAGLKGAVTSSASATLVLLFMNTWLKLAVAVLLAALCFFLWPRDRAEVSVAESAPAAGLDGVAMTSSASSSAAQPQRAAVAVPSESPPASETEASPKLSGRVVDLDGAPLAECCVQIIDSQDNVEELVTDSEGLFVSQVEREAGFFRLSVTDVPLRLNVVRLDGELFLPGNVQVGSKSVTWNGAQPVGDIVARTGPCYLLRFAPPGELSTGDFDAELFDQDPAASPPSGGVLSFRTLVRGDLHPFARFGGACGSSLLGFAQKTREDTGVRGPRRPTWTLRVTSRDGRWAGQARVNAPDEPHDVVDIVLKPAASARLEFVASTGVALSEPAIRLEHLQTHRIHKRSGDDFTGEPLALDLIAFEPGRYRLMFRAKGMQDIHEQLELAAGVPGKYRFTLEPRSFDSVIRGVLRSRSGRFRGGAVITLARADQTGTFVETLTHSNGRVIPTTEYQGGGSLELWTEESGELVAPFVFEGLAPGDYRIAVRALDSPNLRWISNSDVLRVPSEGLEYELDDTTPTQRVVFQVTNSSDGALLETCVVRAWSGEQALECNLALSEGRASVEFYADAALRWQVSAPGFQPQSGDSSTFVADGDGLVQVVALEPVR